MLNMSVNAKVAVVARHALGARELGGMVSKY